VKTEDIPIKDIGNQNNTTKQKIEKVEQLSVFGEKQNNATSKKITTNISKGNLLEYRLKRLLFVMGYFPKIGVIIKTSQEQQSDVITDLDVYGVYIHKNFSSKTIWADCKAGQARPLERISWINGVKNTIQIQDVVFVKKNVRPSTKQFARKLGIQILDLDIIDKLENDYDIQSNDWRGSWNPETQHKKLTIFQKINVPSNDIFKKIGNFIISAYWTFDDYTKIKKTLTAIKQLSAIEQAPLPEEQLISIRWAIFELINLFVLATLNISKELYYFSDEEKKDTILNGLISGEISPQKRAEIIEATYKTAYIIIQRQIPDFKAPLQIPNLGMNPPQYFEAFYDLVLRITNNPLDYYDLLRFLDFIFMEYDLLSKEIDEAVLKDIFRNHNDLIISAKTILHFVCNITGISKSIFQLMR
jgi:hypothetical protein